MNLDSELKTVELKTVELETVEFNTVKLNTKSHLKPILKPKFRFKFKDRNEWIF